MNWDPKLLDRMTRGTRTNDRGNLIRDCGLMIDTERYEFDFRWCKPEDGWQQFDTSQDAHYFGVWVNRGLRLTVTYCEGDLTVVECSDEQHFTAELASMAEFYGPPPPAFKTIDDNGQVTHYYDQRPV